MVVWIITGIPARALIIRLAVCFDPEACYGVGLSVGEVIAPVCAGLGYASLAAGAVGMAADIDLAARHGGSWGTVAIDGIALGVGVWTAGDRVTRRLMNSHEAGLVADVDLT